jgi:ADP-ribosyl-[dinitrogen reductase] hydrolase
MTNVKNYQGAMLGLAVGDALGATTENMWTYDIRKQYGIHQDIVGGGWLRLKPGQVTDDTDMTMAVAYGVLKDSGRSVINYIGEEFVKWFNSKPVDVGNITRIAIQEYIDQRRKKSWAKAGKFAHDVTGGKSAGNGSLMRCLPVALAYQFDREIMEIVTEKQGEMTHYDPLATEACKIYNRIALRVIQGEELKKSIREEIRDTRYAPMTKQNPMGRPSGYVVDTFEWVLRVLLTSYSYEQVIIKLANAGSDSDTTAAIAGGLAGLYYGVDEIPARLADKIIRKDEILLTAERLYAISGKEAVK